VQNALDKKIGVENRVIKPQETKKFRSKTLKKKCKIGNVNNLYLTKIPI